MIGGSKARKFFDPHFSTESFRQRALAHQTCYGNWIPITHLSGNLDLRNRLPWFEYEYEYHFIEYEYDCKPNCATSKLVLVGQ